MIKVTIAPFVLPQTYQSGKDSSCYQMDMLFHGLNQLDDVLVQQIPENPMMFADMNPEELKSVWGGGNSLYGLLKKSVRFPSIESDLVIAPIHHTLTRYQEDYGEFLRLLVKKFKKVVAVDGWDMPDYSEANAAICPYFKRELQNDRKTAIPIFFAIPEEKFILEKIDKIYDFSPMIPVNMCTNHEHLKSYIYKTEEEYYHQYRQSYFAYNSRKAGWATGRQNEIIACGSIPYFTDIEGCFPNCLYNYPKELCIEVKKMKGVHPGTINPFNPEVCTYIGDTRQIKCGEERGYIDFDVFDQKLYNTYLDEFQRIGLEKLTTKALAKYVLEKSL